MLRIQTICLVILTLIASGFALHYLQSVLLPFVVAFFVVSGCRPILNYLENRFGLNWVLSFAVTFGIGLVLLVCFSILAWASINDLSDNFPRYQQQIEKMTDRVGSMFAKAEPQPTDQDEENPADDSESTLDPNPSDNSNDSDTGSSEPENTDPENAESGNDDAGSEDAGTAETGNAEAENTNQEQQDLAADSDAQQDLTVNTPPEKSVEQLFKEFMEIERARANQPLLINPIPRTDSNIFLDPRGAMQQMLKSIGDYLQSFILGIAGALTGLLSSAVLVLIYVFFLLLGRAESTKTRAPIVKAIDDQIRKYIVMKTVISMLTGIATWIVLASFNVPLAIVFGLLTFLINYIPNIGPIIISLLPVPFLFLGDMNPWVGLLVFVLVATIQFVSGNVIETRLMGKSFDVNPVILLLSLMFFGLIWGIPGMFLATPIVSVIKIVLQSRETTKPFADLLAGRWNGEGFGGTQV